MLNIRSLLLVGSSFAIIKMIDLTTWRANIGALASRSYTQRDTRRRFFTERVLKQRTKPPQRFTAVQCKSEEVAIPHALLIGNSTVVTPLPTKASRGRNIASVSKEGPAQRSSMPMRAAPQGNSGRWCSSVAVKMMCGTLLFLGLCVLLLRVAGDVEVNPGPGRLGEDERRGIAVMLYCVLYRSSPYIEGVTVFRMH